MNGAEFVAKYLKSQGVARVFGLPGGENVVLIEALRRAGLEFVLVHHEAAAGFAADVTGQLTDRPGVCLSTVGPGAVNLLATAISATLERSPVLAITAEIDQELQSRVTHMRADLSALFSAGTKASIRLTSDNMRAELSMAWKLALEAPRGAVHVALSPEIAVSPISKSNGPSADLGYPESADLTAFSADRDRRNDNARQRLLAAERPFLLAGIGVESGRASDALVRLVEAWNTPVAVTPKAKGQFPENHPLFAGCFSAYGDISLRQALEDADAILGIGLDGVDLVTSTWDISTPLINACAGGADDPVFQPIATLEGGLREILTELESLRPPYGHGPAVAAKLRDDIERSLLTPFPDSGGTIKLHDLIVALQHAMDPNGCVTVDVGAFKLVFLQQWRSVRPKSLFVANGLSAMGYAVPGAMAIRYAQPDRTVVAIVGDGALLMYAGELATVSRLTGPLVVLVVVDQALSLIRLKQERQGVAVYGTEFGRVDYRALASAHGLAYALVDGKEGARETLQQALRLDRPVLVEARVNKAEYDHFK
jgi:acetolactate synthase-1/2/3 large subunit